MSQTRSPVFWTLFDVLLSEMGSSAHEKGLRHDYELTAVNLLEGLTETAATLGLDIKECLLNCEQAVDGSGNLTPLIKPLENGEWLVVSGFSRGRIKITIVNEAEVNRRLVNLNELQTLLQTTPERLLEWFAVELKSPMEASSHHGEHHMPPLRRLIAMVKVEQKDLWRVVLLAGASGLLSLATPAAVQSLVNTVALGGMMQPLTVLSFMLFIFLTFYGAVSILQSYIVELIQRRVFVRMAADLAYRLPRVKWSVYDEKNGAELVNRFFDVLTVQKAGAFLMLDGFSMALQSTIGLFVLAAYHPTLMLFDALVVSWLAFVIFIQGRKGVSTSINESIAKYEVVAWLETLARNGHMFKFSGGPELAKERTDKLAYEYLNSRKAHYGILLNQHISLYALYAVAGTALLAVGGLLVMEGQLSLGQLVAAELIVSGVLLSFSKLKKQLESYYDLMAGVDKLGHLLDLPVERESGEIMTWAGPTSIAVHDLTYAYPNGHIPIQHLSFSISAGETVALTGNLGAGKSTLADLLTGLRQPQKGRIEINQLDSREIKLESVRKQIAVIGHNEIIEESILENIRLSRPEITVTQVRNLLNRLQLMSEITQFPAGLYTQLSPSGSPLSSSQVKHLMIARAVISNPGLLIIDGLLDDWHNFGSSEAKQILFSENAPWTLLILTSSESVMQLCQRVINLQPANG